MPDPNRRPGYLQQVTVWRMIREMPSSLWAVIGAWSALVFGLGWLWRRLRR